MNKEHLILKDDYIISPFFSSYADRVCIEVVGSSAESLPCAELYCNTADGESHLYAVYPATADGDLYSCSFFFDPINLQIY